MYRITLVLVLSTEHELFYFLVSALHVYNIKAIKLYSVNGCGLLKIIEV